MSKYIELVRKVVTKSKSPWVLYNNGTFVVVDDLKEGSTVEDVADEAMNQYGQVMPGCSAGDFNVIHTEHGVSVVTGHCPFMYTCVIDDEVEQKMDMMIGLYGRSKRQKDFDERKVVHVEERRD